MKKINILLIKSLCVLSLLLAGYTSFGQGATCGTATIVVMNTITTNFTVNGTGDANSPSLAGTACITTSINESWFNFTATTGYSVVTFQNSGTQTGYVYIYSGTCGSLSALAGTTCFQVNSGSVGYLNFATSISTVYYIRVLQKISGVSGAIGVFSNAGNSAAICTPDKLSFSTGNADENGNKYDNNITVGGPVPYIAGWAKFNTSGLPAGITVNGINLAVTVQSNTYPSGGDYACELSGWTPYTTDQITITAMKNRTTDPVGAAGNQIYVRSSAGGLGHYIPGTIITWNYKTAGRTYSFNLNATAITDFTNYYNTQKWRSLLIPVDWPSCYYDQVKMIIYGWNSQYVPYIVVTYTTSGCTAPAISQHPANATQCEGTNVTFSVTADGSPALSYQWNKTGNTISGATNSSYVLNNISLADAASYNCVVSNACGSITSNAATLTVNSKVVFVDTIPNLTKCEGENVTFSFNAAGTNLSYQWTKGTSGTDITGATNSTYTINNLKQTDYDIYSCNLTNECGPKSLPKFILTVIAPPTSNVKFVNQTKYFGDNASYSLSPGGTSPFIFQWIKGGNNLTGETNSIFNINYVSCGDSGVYSCKISNSCSSITAKIVNLYVLGCSRFKYAITGNVEYDNKDSTPMTNTVVHLLNMGDTLIDNNTTDINGYYVFVDLINDIYKINCITTKAWGGCNPSDALLVNKHYIGTKFITDPLKKRAADVNNDGKINPTDALMINRRYIGLLPRFIDKDKNILPDWLFSDPTVDMAGFDITQNILAICTGDVNGSYTPPLKSMNYELGIIKEKEIKVETGQPFDLPVYLNESTELGAIGLKFKVSGSKFHVIDVRSDIEGLLYNVTGDGVNIAWSAENQGVNITPDKPVLILKAVYNGIDNSSGLMLNSESIIADINDNFISTDKIVVPKMQFGALPAGRQVQSLEFGLQTYPNPFSTITNINYTLPEDANVKLSVYNVLGEKISTLTDARQASGRYILQFDGSALKQGVYYCRIEALGTSSVYTKTNILIITR